MKVTKKRILQDLIKLFFLLIKHTLYEYDYSPLEGYINYLEKYTEGPWGLNYNEEKTVDSFQSIIGQAKKDILGDGHTYLWDEDKSLNDYQKGVWSVLRMIMFRIHCIND